MTASPLHRGGVLAAGEGTRLEGHGPKPLVEVGGRTLLERALDRLHRARLDEGVVICRDAAVGRAAEAWAARRAFALRVLVEATPSSAVSFRRLVDAFGGERGLVTTVDAVLDPDAFAAFLAAANAGPSDALGLGVTSWVDDEKPLWVDWSDDGTVASLGGPSGRSVTAGLYVVPPGMVDVAAAHPPSEPLRRLLGTWVSSGRPTWALPLATVLDVDRPADLEAAEAFLGEGDAR